MPASINLLNQEFGNWKVIKKLPSKNNKTYWLCKCQICGLQKEIQTCHLRNNTYAKCCDNSKYQDNIKKCDICGKNFIPKTPQANKRRFCYECSPSYDKDDRASNITAIRHAIKRQLVEYKGGKCCKCGYNKSIKALQFHHLNPNEKEFTIASNLRLSDFNMQNYYNEVDKCLLLCANCHAEIHDQ